MATWEGHVATYSGGSVYIRVNIDQGTQSSAGNWTDVSWSVQSRDTHGGVSGTWDWNRSGFYGSASGSVGAATGTRTIQSGTTRVYHDGNGNGSAYGYAWLDAYYGQGSTSGTLGLSRLGLAPESRNKSVDTITATSARLGAYHSNNGRGSSSAMRVYYRLDNTGGWSQTSDQGGTGWKYWSVGFSANSMYGYFSRHWNNNGDSADTGTSTFVTLAQQTGTPTYEIKSNKIIISGVNVTQGYYATSTKVQYRIVGSSTWLETSAQSGTGLSFTLHSLKANKQYEIRYSVTTTAGTNEMTSFNLTTKRAANWMPFLVGV